MKAKFDKNKCLKCKYHQEGPLGWPVRVKVKGEWKTIKVYCNYNCVTGTTCLRPAENYENTDLRGDDYDNCRLFSEGPAIKTEKGADL